MTETAFLAGGRFRGLQELLRCLPGVVETTVGYAGGDILRPTHGAVGTHAETVALVFDPDEIAYRRVLEFFFQIHDPTTPDRQGEDVGPRYRSAIFYETEAQRQVAEAMIVAIEASGRWPGPVVTQVRPVGPFWPAAAEHPDYLQRVPDGPSGHVVRPGWVLPGREPLQMASPFGRTRRVVVERVSRPKGDG